MTISNISDSSWRFYGGSNCGFFSAALIDKK